MKTLLPARNKLPKQLRSLTALSRPVTLAIMALIAGVSVSAQPQQAWVARYNGGLTNQTHTPLALALDHSGNVYVAGSSQNASNLYDYVVLKYTPNGTQLFAARYSSTNGANHSVNGFALDQNGNAYETGTGGTVKFANNGALAWTAPYSGNDVAVDTNGNTYVTGFSTSTYATVKLNSIGSNLWLRTHININGYTPAISQKVAVDNTGNVYVAGYETWAPYGYARPLIIKYDGMGNPVWTNTTEGGESFGTTKGLIADNQGNLYVTANDDTYYDTGKKNSSGQDVWGFVYGQPGVAAMVIDTNGNVYLTGALYNGVNYGTVCATLKINDTGNLLWERNYVATSTSYPVNSGNGIVLDSMGNVYVTGVSTNAGTGTDFATIKYDSNGNQIWVLRYNGPANGNDGGDAIAVDNNGNVYVTGYSANASGGTDIVTIKYSPLTLQRRLDGTVLLQGQGSPGESFDIQASTNLQSWLDLGSVMADTNGLMQFDDTNASNYNARFYVTSPQ